MAFPSTAILDDFTRSNENPIGTPWAAAPLIPAEDRLQVVSNRGKGTNAAAFNSGYLPTSYEANAECYFTVSTADSGNRIEAHARVVDINVINGTDGYCVSVAGSAWGLRVFTNSSSTAVGGLFTGPVLANGDGLGFRISAGLLEAWHKPAAGSWTQLFTRSDSTWNAVGFIGARMFGTTFEIDDFGGGSIVDSGLSYIRA